MMDTRTSAENVMRCDLCKIAVVQMYCDTCLVKLCKACVGEHAFYDKSKRHEILRFQKSTPFYSGCTSHDKKRCEMFCNQCHIPVCHTYHELSKMMQVMEEKISKIAEEKNESSETIFQAYQYHVSDVPYILTQLEIKSEQLSTTITKHGEDWHREIDTLVQKLKAAVEEMKTIQLHILQKHLDDVNKKISNINDGINSRDFALDSNDLSKVFDIHLPQKILSSLPNFIQGRIQGEELYKLFGTLSSMEVRSEEHGYSIKPTQRSPETASSSVIKQLLDEPHTVTTIHTGCRELYNVACLSDEEIWTVGDDNTMALYSINQGSLLKSISTKSGNTPEDITVTKSGNLVYTDYWDKTVNMVKNEEIQTVIRLQGWRPHGVCSTSDEDLLVIMDSEDNQQSIVARYSGSTEKQTIQFDNQDWPLYSSGKIKYICENRNLDICVADCGNKRVVVVNQAGKLRFRYSPPKKNPFNPQGITTDSQSRILITDDYKHRVYIIDENGQYLRYIYCGRNDPRGLHIDNNDNLFVAQSRNKRVKKIKYQQ